MVIGSRLSELRKDLQGFVKTFVLPDTDRNKDIFIAFRWQKLNKEEKEKIKSMIDHSDVDTKRKKELKDSIDRRYTHDFVEE